MVAQVIQIGKRRWLAGMEWATYPDMPDRDTQKGDAARWDATWVALRQGEHSIQGGYCAAIEGESLGHLNGRINGLFSLAAMLADSREQPWLGQFQIAENLWWYIAVRDGHAIIPHGDVLGDKDAINAAREVHSGLPGWKYITGDLELLEQLIDEIGEKPTPVKSMVVNWKLRKALAASGLFTIAVIGAGAYWWKDQSDKKTAAELARVRAELLQQKSPPVSATLATTIPQPTLLLQRCAERIDVEISQHGWEVSKVACSTSQATIVWERKDGATIEYRPEGVLSDNGMLVTQTLDLGLAQTSKDDRIELSQARLKLLSWAQAANLKLSEEAVAAQAPLPGSETTTPQVAAEKPVTITLGFSPFDLDLSSLPGLRISEIASKEQGEWDLKGVLYGI